MWPYCPHSFWPLFPALSSGHRVALFLYPIFPLLMDVMTLETRTFFRQVVKKVQQTKTGNGHNPRTRSAFQKGAPLYTRMRKKLTFSQHQDSKHNPLHPHILEHLCHYNQNINVGFSSLIKCNSFRQRRMNFSLFLLPILLFVTFARWPGTKGEF